MMRDIFPMPAGVTFLGELFFGVVWGLVIAYTSLFGGLFLVGAFVELFRTKRPNPHHCEKCGEPTEHFCGMACVDYCKQCQGGKS